MPFSISACSADPTEIAADNFATSTVTATVVDENAAAAPAGTPVTWAVTGSGTGSLDVGTNSVTNDSGVAIATLTVSAAGIVIVTVTTDDDSTGMQATVIADKALDAPIVLNATEADNYTLDQYDLDFGVTAIIPPSTDLHANTAITFHWGPSEYSFAVENPVTDLPYIIDVTKNLPPADLEDGVYDVYYVATDDAGNATPSAHVTITVDTGGGDITPTLPEPLVPEADPYINIADASDGTIVTASYATMAAGDLITLFWKAFDKEDMPISTATYTQQYTVLDADVTNLSHDFTVPENYFLSDIGGYEGYANASYSVLPTGVDAKAEVSRTTQCLVDTVAPL